VPLYVWLSRWPTERWTGESDWLALVIGVMGGAACVWRLPRSAVAEALLVIVYVPVAGGRVGGTHGRPRLHHNRHLAATCGRRSRKRRSVGRQHQENVVRPLRYSINVTPDGCCDHRAGSPDEESHRYATATVARADALLFGRVTYQMMEAAFREPARTGVRPDWMEPWMVPFAHAIDAAKKYVVSGTLDRVDWNAELLRGDLAAAVRRLKAEPGNGLYVGGVTLPLALAELGLIDEYEFIVQPRIAGHGPAPFAGLSKSVDLKLVGRQEFASGAVALRYEPRTPAGA
jgi:dihydrofolate reductase